MSFIPSALLPHASWKRADPAVFFVYFVISLDSPFSLAGRPVCSRAQAQISSDLIEGFAWGASTEVAQRECVLASESKAEDSVISRRRQLRLLALAIMVAG